MPALVERTRQEKRREAPSVSVFREAVSMRKMEPSSAEVKSGGCTDDGLAAPAISSVSVMGSPAVQTRTSSAALTLRLEAIAPHHDAGRPAAGGSETVSVSGFVRSVMFESSGTCTARLKRSRPTFTPVMSGTSTFTGSRRTVPGVTARHGARGIVRRHPLSASRATTNGNSWRRGPRRPNMSMPSSMSNGSSIMAEKPSVT